MTIDIERLKQRYDHADGGDDPCDLVLDTQTVRELIAIAERHDALAAHVDAANHTIDAWGDYELSDDEAALAFADWRGTKSETSLAQRDARVAAEALEEAAHMAAVNASLRCIDDNGNWLRELANDWRRNAEGGEL